MLATSHIKLGNESDKTRNLFVPQFEAITKAWYFMKIKAATTAMLSLAITAGAQITKKQKYDWGWSYKLEMPETGLK